MSKVIPFSEHIASLDKKIIGSVVLIRDISGKILIVKPTYKDGWLLPGGSVEKNESPYRAGVRETFEELGLNIDIKHLMVVDYAKRHKKGIDYEVILFVFDGGVITEQEISKIKLQTEELSEYRFVSKDEITDLLNNDHSSSIQATLEALKNNKVYFLENGIRVA